MPIRYLCLLACCGLIFISFSLHAQTEEVSTDSKEDLKQDNLDLPLRVYDTQKYSNFICNTGSGKPMEMRKDWDELVREIEDRVKDEEQVVEVQPLNIEVIFHVLSSRDVKQSMADITTYITTLNQDFTTVEFPKNHLNDPKGIYMQRAASPRITLSLAKHPEARISDGIAVVKDVSEVWTGWDEMKSTEHDGSAAIEPSKYLNIWVCHLPSDKGSYSTSPYVQTAEDGIVIDARFLGDPSQPKNDYGGVRTLQHLIYSYLGLHELWNDDEECKDDYVDDTIIANGPNLNPGPNHISTCPGRPLEMTMNIMDSTPDDMQVMITYGQVKRINAFLKVVRPQLITNSKSKKL